MDQLFAILALQDELRVKAPSENLMAWYVKALKSIEDLNAITRTYRQGCNLMILPIQLAESLYKVHAHKDGYAEVMSRVARDNQGYMPIAELQKAIAMITVDKNRQRALSAFDSLKHPKAHAMQSQVTTAAAKSRSGKIDCCYKFLEGKCQDANCKRPHLQMEVPAGVCGDYLADRTSCYGSCGKLHERWGDIIRKANEGKLPSAKACKPKKVKESAVAPIQPTVSQDSESDSDSGGQGDKSVTGGSQASAKSGPQPCTRCGKIGHEFASCYSSTHFDGSWLKSPKPCPVPEELWAVDQTWEARGNANKKSDINTMRAQSVMADQYMNNGIVSEEEAFWPTHHVNVVCGQRSGADSPTALGGNCPPLALSNAGSDADSDADSNAVIVPLKPDSLVIATEESDNCQ